MVDTEHVVREEGSPFRVVVTGFWNFEGYDGDVVVGVCDMVTGPSLLFKYSNFREGQNAKKRKKTLGI